MHHNGDLNGGELFTMVRVRQGEIVAQFALDELTAGTIFSFLQAHRHEIDAAFSDAPAWRTAGIRTHEIEVRRPADITDTQAWPEYFDWFLRQLSAFQQALWPFVGRQPPAGSKRQWDEESFFAELAASTPTAVAPARELLRWSQANMSVVEWGHGKRYGSFVPRARREGRLYGPFSVWTNGTFILRFAGLKKEWPFDQPAVRLSLLERVNLLPHVDLAPEAIDALPALPLPLLAEPAALERFCDVLTWVLATIRSR
jgi:hypothetical protein